MTTAQIRRPLLASLLLPALWLPATIGQAQQVQTVLGQNGTVYQLHEGRYGELFEDRIEADAESPVLALDVRHADGSFERLLIPGTETSDQESSASMVFEDQTGIIYLAWETLFNDQHPLLHLTSFDGAEWSELIEITSNIFAGKGEPQLVVLREADQIVEQGSETNRCRTTLHLTWWEESEGISRKLHALIILDQGEYIGWAPILDLSNYVLETEVADPLDVPGLENTLDIRKGRNHRTIVSGFINPLTHRLITLEIEALSQVISNVADAIRDRLVVLGHQAESHATFIETAYTEVLSQGTMFHEAARQYLAEEVATIIEQSDFSPAGVNEIADLSRAQIIVIGLRIGPGGLANPRGSEIIAVGDTANDDAPQHYYQVTVVSDRPAPEVGDPAELMLSESGRNVIVTWEEETEEGSYILYRESQEDGWSDPSSIELTEDLDRDTVYRMLAERIRGD